MKLSIKGRLVGSFIIMAALIQIAVFAGYFYDMHAVGIAAGILLSIVFGLVIGNRVGRPIAVVNEHLTRYSKGDISLVDDPSVQAFIAATKERSDEIGELARGVEAIREYFEKKGQESAKISQKDLTVDVSVASDRDKLGREFRQMVINLGQVVGEINGTSAGLASSSNDVSKASMSLSQGATEQASSLEEISASMSTVASQTKTNAENASEASSLARETKFAAEGGSSKMSEMVSAMGQINESSQQIARIIKVIDDIAFQTNLLALNAAVEAARAGRHGKGFAVVAEEVRNLAGRSAKAAKETAELIETSGNKVEHGLAVATETSESFHHIESSIAKVTDLIEGIAMASSEQAQGVSQINIGLSQIDKVTQQNTTAAEQTAAAADILKSQANHLREIVGQFKFRAASSQFQQPSAMSDHRLGTSPSSTAPTPRARLEDNHHHAQQRQTTTARHTTTASSFHHQTPNAAQHQDQQHAKAPKTERVKAPADNFAADKPKKPVSRKEEILSLDDKDFGKY